jgi:tetratricopeptide (TPR) repeat protein
MVTLMVLSLVATPLWAESLPEQAQQALLKGDWAGVLAVLEKSDIKDADVPCRMVAAHACLATNRNNHALILFLSVTAPDELGNWKAWTKPLAEKHPESPVSNYLHADALARAGDMFAAEEAFTRAIERNANLGPAWVGRGTVRALQGKKDEAYMDLLKATQVQPNLADAHASLGCLEVMLQNAEGALEAFNEALRIDPNFALAYNGRGCARYGLGKPDEAFLDFEMANTLCPALVMTEANQSFVLAMVARKVDEKMPRLQKPGTTLTTRSEARERVSLLDPTKIQATFERDGPDTVLHNLYQIRNDLIGQITDIHNWTKQNERAIEWDNGIIIATEYGKAATAALGVGRAVRSGFQAFLTHTGISLGEEGIRSGFGQLPEPAPRVARMVTSSIAWNAVKGAGFDPRGFLFQGAQEMAREMVTTRQKVGDGMCRTAATAGLMLRDVDRAIQNVQEVKLAKQLQSGTVPSSRLTGLNFTSAQPWSQMPELLNDLTVGKNLSGPALLVAQDPVKSYGFQRMLENKGIRTVITSPVDSKQLAELGNVLKPSAVVGFPRDLDDIQRKIMPLRKLEPFFKPPDKFGGAGVGPSIPITRQANTFSFPGTGGKIVTLPMPSGFNTPSATWNSFKPWTPKGHVGGVRTKDLEWVFVDKGNWPVMTFFTLAYSPTKQ